MDDKIAAWTTQGRKTHQFDGPNGLALVVAVPDEAALDSLLRDARDVYGQGSRWRLQGGAVVVDFYLRCLLEVPRARLDYVILDGEQRVLLAAGQSPDRRIEGGEMAICEPPWVYRF